MVVVRWRTRSTVAGSGLVEDEDWRAGELESWENRRAGELENWRTGELENWRLDEGLAWGGAGGTGRAVNGRLTSKAGSVGCRRLHLVR
ncbi:hypothetical protein E4U53_005165 [Claviceps sorghi]|nr:hypothetical protein E4U53_005165 [Claviceps sorghi]